MTLPPLTANAWLRWDVVSRALPDRLGDVLEIGCGQGAVGARIAARSAAYLGVEPDAASCAVARERLARLGEVRQGLVPDVIEPGRRFDLVCSFEVIEHVQDDLAALRGWLTLLRPGGHAVLSAPAFASRYGPSDAMVGHYRRYDPPALQQLLEQAGLVDVRLVLYGAGLGVALERARDVLGARRLRAAGLPVPHGAPVELEPEVMARLSAGSGRLFQPPPVAARALELTTAPFRWYQRTAPDRGTGVVAMARTPAAG